MLKFDPIRIQVKILINLRPYEKKLSIFLLFKFTTFLVKNVYAALGRKIRRFKKVQSIG